MFIGIQIILFHVRIRQALVAYIKLTIMVGFFKLYSLSHYFAILIKLKPGFDVPSYIGKLK